MNAELRCIRFRRSGDRVRVRALPCAKHIARRAEVRIAAELATRLGQPIFMIRGPCPDSTSPPAVSMDHIQRIVISKRYTGLGDCVTSLLGAWRFARRTGRSLVADWRFSCYSVEPDCNLFATIFLAPPLLAGVRFLGDDRVNDLQPAGSYYMPRIWNPASIHTAPVEGERGDGAEIMALLRGNEDAPEDIVVFEQCLGGGFATEAESYLFFSALQPVPIIAERIERFAEKWFSDRYVIGVHIRHGNGGNIMGHAPYWRSAETALGQVTRSIASCFGELEKRGDRKVVVFLCTDSEAIEAFGRSHWPNVVCRPKHFNQRGKGELHLAPESWRGVHDGVAEMFLLARSDVLIRYPESSFANLAQSLKRPEPSGLVYQKAL